MPVQINLEAIVFETGSFKRSTSI